MNTATLINPRVAPLIHPRLQAIRVTQTASTVEVRMDIPEIEPEDLDVRVSGDSLTIAGERMDQWFEKGLLKHRVESFAGTFSRTVSLPCPIRERGVVAKYQYGVLRVTLPKIEKPKPTQIRVTI